MQDIIALVEAAHDNAKDKGFYPKGVKKNLGEILMLTVSELGEALEADRKGRHAKTGDLDQYLWHGNDEQFKATVKDTFEDEIADVIIRLFDLCGYLDIEIDRFIEAKMRYNAGREPLHGKRY